MQKKMLQRTIANIIRDNNTAPKHQLFLRFPQCDDPKSDSDISSHFL